MQRIFNKFSKHFGVLIGLLLMAPILAVPINSAKANYSIDNKCSYVDTAHEDANAGGGYYQTFYAKENRITSAVLMLAALNIDSTATLKIMDSDGNQLAAQTLTVSGANPVVPAPYSFDNFSPVTVTLGQMYKLVILRSAGNSLYWYKTTVCDISGNGYVDGASFPGMDYVFTTYGYTENTPAPTPAPSTQIAAPTSATATYSASTKKVKVNWTKSSTADIDGYHIYRSEDQTKSFTKTGQTESSIVEYLDAGMVAKKTYYYYIKAYKGTDESAQSNTASVAIPANSIGAAISNSQSQTNWFFYLLFGGVALLFIIFLIIYELKLKKIWARPKPEKHDA